MKRRTTSYLGPKRPRNWSRREFLAGTTAAGLAIGLPPWLAGCGGDDAVNIGPTATPLPTVTPTPIPRGPREDTTLHFDLSDAPQLEELEVHVFGSEDNLADLELHTGDSREHFRDDNLALREVSDSNLTHFIEDVDLPLDALQLFWITGIEPRTGDEVLAGLNIHVPSPVIDTMLRLKRASGRRLMRSAKMKMYGMGSDDQGMLAEMLPFVPSFVTIVDAAVAIVFQHPEILNLNLGEGSNILDLIQTLPCDPNDETCDPFLFTLASHLAQHWPATESGLTTFNMQQVEAWAKLVPVMDPDGKPIVDMMGDPVFSYDPTDETMLIAATVASRIRRVIFNEGQYEGFHWHPTPGVAEQENTSTSVFFGGGAAEDTQVVGSLAQGTTTHGVEFTKIAITNQAKRSVEVELRNHWLRYVGAYVQYATEGGDLPVVDKVQEDTDRAKFLKLLNCNFTVFGVPLLGNDVARQTLNFDVPENATKARLYLGSFGAGGDPFCPEAVRATVTTLVFNVGLPTLFLVGGVAVGAGLQGSINGFLATPSGNRVVAALVTRAIALAGPSIANGIFASQNSKNAGPAIATIGSALLSIFTSSAAEAVGLVAEIGLAFTIGQAAQGASGPVGIALKAASVLANLSTITQTMVEFATSPAVFTNTLSFVMTTRITVLKDPMNATFPARARNYKVTLTYDQASNVIHTQSGPIEAGQTELEVVFEEVPSGGKVTIDVVLTSADGWIVGRSTDAMGNPGPRGPLDNNPATAGNVEITLKELLIPLTQQTRYLHERKVEFRNGGRTWVTTATAPTATRSILCQGQDDRLCELHGITVSQRTGNLGYAFQAGGQNVVYCGANTGGIMHMVQNLSVVQGTDPGFKSLPCGFRQPAGIVYDRLGDPGGVGFNFFVQPGLEGYLVQSIVLKDSSPIDLGQRLTWGRFSQPMDALVVHPAGYVVGVNRNTHKMEILTLPKEPLDIVNAPNAVPFASIKAGEGERDGLLIAPVALATHDGAVLVLETGNKRVQAFDVSGNPVRKFKNRTAAFFALSDSANSTYLDLGVDGAGYVYVLSYLGSGTQADDYRLEIYNPQGNFLVRTAGFAAARFAVDTFRTVYSLNYETLAGAPRVEPSLSQWGPSTPMS